MTPDQIRSMPAGPELAHAVKMLLRSYDAYQEGWEVNGEMQAKQQAAFDAWRSKVEALLALMEGDHA